MKRVITKVNDKTWLLCCSKILEEKAGKRRKGNKKELKELKHGKMKPGKSIDNIVMRGYIF